MTLKEYLEGRRKTIESIIAAERLAGNTFKEACEKTALAEITALECALACGDIKQIESPKICLECDRFKFKAQSTHCQLCTDNWDHRSFYKQITVVSE